MASLLKAAKQIGSSLAKWLRLRQPFDAEHQHERGL
jgi:hypothetical protein